MFDSPDSDAKVRALGSWAPYRHERSLFIFSAIFSGLMWLALTVGTFGIGLVYILAGAVGYLFVQSALIARLKGTGALIRDRQYPEIMACVRQCAQIIGMDELPQVYLYEGGGIVNAFAARFLGRNFVVLLSDVVVATEANPNALRFYVGHELGHIRRGHLKWLGFLLPARLFPFLGAAYSRACEYTCDAIGLSCCLEPKDAVHALAVLAVGGRHAAWINVDEYAGQARLSSGFWMSFHELLSPYPWLVKRVGQMVGQGKGQMVAPPRRHIGAWMLALPAGSSGLALVAVLIGAIAFGALGQDGGLSGYIKSITHAGQASLDGAAAKDESTPGLDDSLATEAPLAEAEPDEPDLDEAISAALDTVRPTEAKMEQYFASQGTWPTRNADIKLAPTSPSYGASIAKISLVDGGLQVTFAAASALAGVRVEIFPHIDEVTKEISWSWDYLATDESSGH